MNKNTERKTMLKPSPIRQLNDLSRTLKPGQVITDAVELLTYRTDAALDHGDPDGVILAQTGRRRIASDCLGVRQS